MAITTDFDLPQNILPGASATNYNLSVRTIDLGSLTTYVVCVNFYISGGTYSLTSTRTDFLRIFFFMSVFVYSQNFCQKYDERKSPKKYISYFNF